MCRERYLARSVPCYKPPFFLFFLLPLPLFWSDYFLSSYTTTVTCFFTCYVRSVIIARTVLLIEMLCHPFSISHFPTYYHFASPVPPFHIHHPTHTNKQHTPPVHFSNACCHCGAGPSLPIPLFSFSICRRMSYLTPSPFPQP